MSIDPLLPPPTGPARHTSVPPPPPPPAAPARTAPPAPPAPPAPVAPLGVDADLQDLLDRLHEDMALGEQSPVVPVGTSPTSPTNVTRPSLASDVVIEVGDGIAFQPTFASFGARFAGLLIDVLVLTACCLPGIALLALGSGGATTLLGAILMFAGFCVATVVYARGVSRRGQSIGNRVTNTHVVDARNGHFVAAGDAGTRYVLRMLISMILFIGFLMALGNSQRRTFHDNVAGTVVIRPARASWSIEESQ